MKLYDQVVSLELAKKLKELGVKQESLYWWTTDNLNFTDDKCTWILEPTVDSYARRISAFTVAELLDISPASTSMLKRTDLPTKKIPRYYVETFEHYRDQDYDSNPANALAKMLIYLLENKLVTV